MQLLEHYFLETISGVFQFEIQFKKFTRQNSYNMKLSFFYIKYSVRLRYLDSINPLESWQYSWSITAFKMENLSDFTDRNEVLELNLQEQCIALRTNYHRYFKHFPFQ